ncbi:MAG: phage head closure protein [Oscillospiraceae bacterium]|nr:phage head closure protein [Oscillospiraceae bacterium]
MSFDDVCTLVSTTIETDEIGQEIKSAGALTEIFCKEKSASGNEFYRAASNDIKAEKVIETDKENYSGQQLLIYEGIKYSIYRTYVRAEDGVIELYCTQKAGV